MKNKRNPTIIFILHMLFCLLIAAQSGYTGEKNPLKREFSLKGKWLFEIGDNPVYCDPEFNDNHWVNIPVPKHWENAGFPGYDGYAWYRIHFKFHNLSNSREYHLKLGQIDDVDMVYLNGKLIGSTGSFPPVYKTAYGNQRDYYIPFNLLKDSENVLAVRVFDEQGPGGIYHGDIGIYSSHSLPLIQNFAGYWKFSPGDYEDWKNPDYDDSEWPEVMVPVKWEDQDYPLLDGFAWYRKEVEMPAKKNKEHLILVLGRIDDQDEVYLNGQLIGRTGQSPLGSTSQILVSKYRFYYIPPSLIHWGSKNIIAVRVFDVGGEGGILKGPIGITTRKTYLRIKRYY